MMDDLFSLLKAAAIIKEYYKRQANNSPPPAILRLSGKREGGELLHVLVDILDWTGENCTVQRVLVTMKGIFESSYTHRRSQY